MYITSYGRVELAFSSGRPCIIFTIDSLQFPRLYLERHILVECRIRNQELVGLNTYGSAMLES